MIFDFATAQDANSDAVTRLLSRHAAARAANDNCVDGDDAAPSDLMLQAALRHFAQHGLGAARAARAKAEDAFFAGDRAAYDWWLGITRTLDRRIAEQARINGSHFAGGPDEADNPHIA